MTTSPETRNLQDRLNRVSLRYRLLIMILVPLLIGFVLLIAFGRQQMVQVEQRSVTRGQVQLTNATIDNINVVLNTLPDTTTVISNSASLQQLVQAEIELRRADGPSTLDQVEWNQLRMQALNNMTNRIYTIMVRSTLYKAVRVYDNEGHELLRIDTDATGVTRNVLTDDLGSVSETDYFSAVLALSEQGLHVSTVWQDANGVSVLQLSRPVYFEGELIGGITIDVRADTFLRLVYDSDLEPNQYLVLVDNDGLYLADTRGVGGYLFGRDADGGGATLAAREPALQAAVEDELVGQDLDDYVVTSQSFFPMAQDIDGTPWHIMMLEDSDVIAGRVQQAVLIYVLVAIAILAALVGVLYQVGHQIAAPITEAVEVATRITAGDLTARIPVTSEDEMGRLGRSINQLTSQWLVNISVLEDQFSERTRDLEVASEIANIAVGIDDMQTLLDQTVNLIRDRFSFYHVQVFFVNAIEKKIELVASTGEAGQTMLDLGWALDISGASVVGKVAATGEAIIALDTEGARVVHRPNPHLPDTRSEMALPMRSGSEVIGALDIQSTYANAFTDDDIRIFEVLANQLAIAVSNIRQLAESRGQIVRIQELNRQLTRDTWDTFLETQQDEVGRYFASKAITEGLGEDAGAISAPIQVRGEVIGMLNGAPMSDERFDPDEIALIRAVAERVSLAVENARLVTETQSSLAETERLYISAQAINSDAPEAEILPIIYEQFKAPGLSMVLDVFSGARDEDGYPAQMHRVGYGVLNPDGMTDHDQWIPVEGPIRPYYAAIKDMQVANSVEEIKAKYPPAASASILAIGIQARLALPMIVGGAVLGQFMVVYDRPHQFTEREIESYQTLVRQFTTVLRSRQLLAEVDTERQTLQSVIQAMPTAVMVLDAQTRQPLMSNDLARAMLGEDIDMVQLAEEGRLINTDSATPFLLEDTPIMQALRTGTMTFSEDLAVLTSSGQTVDLLSNAAPIMDADGKITSVVSVFQDITELRELQSALQDTLFETTSLYESSRAIFGSEDLTSIAQEVLTHTVGNTLPDTAAVMLTQFASTALETLSVYPEGSAQPHHLFEELLQGSDGTAITLHHPADDDRFSSDSRDTLTAEGFQSLVAIPLAAAGEAVGWLGLCFTEEQTLNPEQTRLLEALSDQAGVALENARLRIQTEAALSQTLLLYNASRDITRANTIQQILDTFVSYSLPPEATQASILTVDIGSGGAMKFSNIAEWVRSGYGSTLTMQLMADYITSQMAPEDFGKDEPLIIDNVPSMMIEAGVPEAVAASPELAKSTILLPMVAGERFLGLVQIVYQEAYTHTDDTLRNYQGLVDQVASAVENRRLIEQTQRSLAETERLYRASQIIREAASVEESLVVLQSLVMEYNPSQLDIYLAQRDQIHQMHTWSDTEGVGLPAGEVRWTDDPEENMRLLGHPRDFIENIEQTDDKMARETMVQMGAGAAVSIPMNLRGAPIGRFVMSFNRSRPFSASDRSYMQALADQTAIVLNNWNLLQQTQETLDETRVLYETSSAIADVTDAAGILTSLVDHAIPAAITQAQMFILHGDSWQSPSALMEVAAVWDRNDEAIDLSGMKFAQDQYPGWTELAAEQLLVIADVAQSDAVSEDSQMNYMAMDMLSLIVVPLRTGTETIGALLFTADKPYHPDDRELRTFQSVAELATISLQNINLLQQTQSRARQLQTSAEVSRAVTSILEPGELLPRVVNLIRDNFEYDHVQVFLADETGENAVLQASTGEIGQTMLNMNWSLPVGSESVIGQVMISAEPVVALDTADAEVVHRPNPLLPDVRSELAIPLQSRGRSVGALDVQSNQPSAFSEADVRILASLADQIAVALDNARLFQETQNYTLALSEQVHNLQSLLDASQTFTSTLDDQEILESAARHMAELVNVDHCGIALVSAEDATMTTVRAEYPSTGAVGISFSMAEAWWMDQYKRTSRPVVLDDVETSDLIDDPTREALQAQNVQQIVLLPILQSGEKIIGSIGLDVYEKGRHFTPEDLTLLQLFSTQIATSLENARLFEGQQMAAQALETQVDQMESLYAASIDMSQSLEESTILKKALEGLVYTLQMDAGIAIVEQADPAFADIVAKIGVELTAESYPFAVNDYYNALATTRMPIVIEDLATTDYYVPALKEKMLLDGQKSIVIVPVMLGDRVHGVIGLAMRTRRTISTAEFTLLQTFTAQLNLVLQNADLFARAQGQADDMRFLFNITAAATSSTEMETSMRLVMDELSDYIDGDIIGVYLADAHGEFLDQVAVQTRHPEDSIATRIPMSHPLVMHMVDQRQAIIMDDLPPAYQDAARDVVPNMRSIVAAPFFAGRQLLGSVLLYKREAGAYTAETRQLLQALAGSLSAVVQNIRLLVDISAANDRLRELDKIKSQFFANMSHELRTPLNSIIGFSRVILKGIDGPLTDMQEQDLETIHSSGQHLLGLINEILDQSKIEAEKMTLNIDWFDMNSVIDIAKSMSIGLLKDSNIRLNVELEDGLPNAWGDEIRTRQVLINLLSNAAKFTSEGSITISAFTVERRDGQYMQVSVADTGIGIPENKLDTVFAAFEQVDGSLTRSSGGTGLGLPISKGLIELMGGELWVESTINIGSTFSFIVPVYEKDTKPEEVSLEDDPMKAEAQLPTDQQDVPDRKTIMVIDDEVGMHQMYRRYLNKAGYIVEAISNPIQAEDLVRVVFPDIILLDVRMPQREGWDVLEKFKAHEDTRHIPIIICSIDPDRERGLALGAVDFLQKPFLEDDLLEAIKRAEEDHLPDRLLIIDDKPESVRGLVELLKEQDRMYVQTATSAEQGLQYIQRKKPDLVLLDLNMPEVGGIELLEQLRANPRTVNLPVLVITAEDDLARSEQERLQQVGVYSKDEQAEQDILSGIQGILGHNLKN